MKHDTIEEVLVFWFGPLPDDSYWPAEKAERWFKKDPSFDAEIRERFESLLKAASRGERDDWLDTTRGTLAFVVLLDQFSRNMYRDRSEEYAFDTRCLRVVRQALEKGIDKELRPVERKFLYMPLMHSEDIDDQKLSISVFTRLRDNAPEPLKEYFQLTLDYAYRHKAMIDRFGRFPYRNRQLRRPSTAKEIEFLKRPDSRF